MTYVVTVNGRKYRSVSLAAARKREERAVAYALAFDKPLPTVTITERKA